MKKSLIALAVAFAFTANAQTTARDRHGLPVFTEPAIEAQSLIRRGDRVVVVMARDWKVTCHGTPAFCGLLMKEVETFFMEGLGRGKRRARVIAADGWQLDAVMDDGVHDKIERKLIRAGFILRPKP